MTTAERGALLDVNVTEKVISAPGIFGVASGVDRMAARIAGGIPRRRRSAITTQELLIDDEDRRFERHRRSLDASPARQLDLSPR